MSWSSTGTALNLPIRDGNRDLKKTKLLILGGTGDAVALARALAAEFRDTLTVVTSLAGRTTAPTLPPGEVRVGGFGGPEGLAEFLRAEGFDAVIDATHPFAARMTANAVTACAAAETPRLRLDRPAWAPLPEDRWLEVSDLTAAAAALPGLGARAFLTVGSSDLQLFTGIPGIRFWARMIERPTPPDMPGDPPGDPPGGRPGNFTIIEARGPFSQDAELALMREHGIDVLVTKNSGGKAASAKLAAGRVLDIPVVMVARPPVPPGEVVSKVAEAVVWLRQLAG